MPYAAFDKNKPSGASNGTVTTQEIRDNLMALRDAVVTGGIPGFNCAASGGTEDQRLQYLFTGTGVNAAERVKVTVVWGTTGGATGNPETITFTYSSDSGVSYPITIGVLTVVYTANGYFSSYTWS